MARNLRAEVGVAARHGGAPFPGQKLPAGQGVATADSLAQAWPAGHRFTLDRNHDAYDLGSWGSYCSDDRLFTPLKFNCSWVPGKGGKINTTGKGGTCGGSVAKIACWRFLRHFADLALQTHR